MEESVETMMGQIPDIQYSAMDGALTREMKIEAAMWWLSTNSEVQVAQNMNISRAVIRQWTCAEWWPQAVKVAMAKQGEALDHALSNVLDKAVEGMNDRIENGDYRMTQDGSMVRVPVRLKDLRDVAQMAIDKRQMVRNTAARAGGMSEDEALDKLALRLSRLGTIKPAIEGSLQNDVKKA